MYISINPLVSRLHCFIKFTPVSCDAIRFWDGLGVDNNCHESFVRDFFPLTAEYRKQFVESVGQGLMAAESGEVYSAGEVRKILAK